MKLILLFIIIAVLNTAFHESHNTNAHIIPIGVTNEKYENFRNICEYCEVENVRRICIRGIKYVVWNT